MRRIAASLILVSAVALSSPAQVSTNVPLDHWSYAAVDKLANYGLIDSAMLTIKPITRIEMARHIAQAMYGLRHMETPPDILGSILERLQAEFRPELIDIGILDGTSGGSLVKPIEDPYLRYLYADSDPALENMRGDVYRRHSNYRAGFATRGDVGDVAAFYLHPEYRSGSYHGDNDVDLIEAYAKIMVGPIDIQAGKDSLWWGPGYHGSILMSNHAAPLPMVRITNPQPLRLPWVFRYLGPYKGEWFLAQLEEDRDIPKARLSGVRVNFKPHVNWEIGFSRVAMFGGRGVPRVGFIDYVKIFLARTEQEENNQMAGIDTSILLPLAEIPYGEYLPLRSIKFYIDAAGEDEAGMMPSNWGYLYGLQFNDLLKTGRTDLRIEYADNHVSGKPNVFYNHSLYTSGYTYKDNILGHHMGTDSRDMFVQLSHYLSEDLIVDLAYDHQTHDLSADTHPQLDIYACSLRFFRSPSWEAVLGYRFEDGQGQGYDDNQILQLHLIRNF